MLATLILIATFISAAAGGCIYSAMQHPNPILFGAAGLLVANALMAAVAAGTLIAINNKK